MEVEFFQDGRIIKEMVKSEPDYSLILSLCNRISQSGQQRTILEHILEEICSFTGSTTGTIWNLKNGEKKIVCNYRITPKEDGSIDSLIKKFAENLGQTGIGVVSNDILSDARFKVPRRRIKKNISLPVSVLRKKSIPLSPSFPQCVMIVPISHIGRIVISTSTGKRFETEDFKQVMSLTPLIEKILSGGPDGPDDGMLSMITSVKKSRETNDIKDVFLATISHELRTPLNGIVGMITMLKDAGPLNGKQHEYLTILMECSHQLMTMMNNILDFSKMVSNRLVLLRGPMNISKAVKDASLMVEGKAKSKSLKFFSTIQSNIPALIGDGQRLTQIISNLLSNAVKFTEHGHIFLKVSATLEKSPSGRKESLPYVKKWRVLFEIEDTGIGIPKEEQEKIFEMFHQSSNLDSLMAKNGTGLGLSISRELVKMMGGKIEVQSEGVPGKGTLFKFYIITEEEIKMTDLEGEHKDIMIDSKILVVDDRPEYRMQLTDMLFKWGCKPTVVSSGEEALQHISYGMNFDTIIVDICMPYMNGIELAQELKADKKTANIPLIALSSVDLQPSGTELFDIYMNKPIDQNYLFPAILECLVKKKTGRDSPVAGKKLIRRSSGKEKKYRKDLKILIAEDDPNNSYTIKEMLQYLGFESKNIKTVENGEKCVMEVKKDSYDVILMDILMPIMNGIEATKYIRQLNPRPYIIAVSAAVQNTDKQRCQQVGVDSYLTKPILKEKLNASLLPLVIE